jgi:hypothetical protein
MRIHGRQRTDPHEGRLGTSNRIMVANDQGIYIHVSCRIVGHQYDLIEKPDIGIQKTIHDALPADVEECLVLSVKPLVLSAGKNYTGAGYRHIITPTESSSRTR